MPSFIFHAPCPFGLEGLLADEIRALNADPDPHFVPPKGGRLRSQAVLNSVWQYVCIHALQPASFCA